MFCSANLAVIAQKNTVIVTDAKGTGIKGIVVTIFEGTTGKCYCSVFCNIEPFASASTNDNGHAEFRNATKRFDAGTTYTAFIGAYCTSSRQTCTKQEDCRFGFRFTASTKINTDKDGKFNAVKIIK